jgi:hypothetical protein
MVGERVLKKHANQSPIFIRMRRTPARYSWYEPLKLLTPWSRGTGIIPTKQMHCHTAKLFSQGEEPGWCNTRA